LRGRGARLDEQADQEQGAGTAGEIGGERWALHGISSESGLAWGLVRAEVRPAVRSARLIGASFGQ